MAEWMRCLLWRAVAALQIMAALMVLPLLSQAQVKEALQAYKNWQRYHAITRFYQLNDFRLAWAGNVTACHELVQLLRLSDSLGLDEQDYQFKYLNGFDAGKPMGSFIDSLDADVHLTDAALHFFGDQKAGSQRPAFRYYGLKYDPLADADVAALVLAHLNSGVLPALVEDVQPQLTAYPFLLAKLSWFRRIMSADDFTDVKITSKKADASNTALFRRLYQLGITDSILVTTDKKIITEKIRKAQNFFDVLNDGVLRSTTLAALNVPLKRRVAELKAAICYIRWTERIREQGSVLLLNIPSASLMVFEKGTVVLDSKVIVGKPSTPTPTLASTITDIILYPFWNVPDKIATKELLPAIKRDPGYLDRGNYQVLNSEGRVLNPYDIDWYNLSAAYFPYKIRQGTGCDNALGIVKFNFYNPFTVYLHDTPNKALFAFSKRYFSHGCMRVEKPTELARFLLGKNRVAIDTLTAKGCLLQQAPKGAGVEKRLPIMVMYSTVWFNKEGEVRFFDDIYGRLN